MYKKCFKRCLDFVLSLLALIILSPIFLVLMLLGAIFMRGNPFFTQKRPGKKGEIFKLVKFRSMDNRKDKNGKFLPDTIRLNKYGKFLRSTSLDELPELFNILKGDMSIVGPRPLAVEYLQYYNEFEKQRHDVRPGLTGLAQINGRNALNWPERFRYDVRYVNNVSLKLDLEIIFKTVWKVVKRSDVAICGTTQIIDFDKYRIEEMKRNKR
ncbi:sugar transferase [Faecalimonas sp.]